MNESLASISDVSDIRREMWFSRRLAPIRGLYNEKRRLYPHDFFFGIKQNRLTKSLAKPYDINSLKHFHDIVRKSTVDGVKNAFITNLSCLDYKSGCYIQG